jgi:cellulose synthase (UDP-forming)
MKRLARFRSRAPFERWLIGIAVLLVIGLPFVYSAIVVPLSPWDQAKVSLAMIALALVAMRSRFMRPFIIFLSCFASMRYFYWRVSSTVNFDSSADATVSFLLLLAEIYGLLILFLGYFQTLEVKQRAVPLPKTFPTVDVLIPTYNEAVEIVRRTVIGAKAVDYPSKTIYVLDDGRRPAIQVMAESLGAVYVTRPDNAHAKAGNLNHALKRTTGELIAIFDADHVPVRGFLRQTVGFFEDARVALVQTAQHFFNADPFERNLKLAGEIPPEQHFFYHVIQPGNDFWNSAFFCGSCAVLRRSALEDIGGFRTQTVTEDAHTSMELHSRGYVSIYLPVALAAGLATETYRAHVQQRMRWARGMAQILRTDCPLFKRGLAVEQRLNYFNAMLHFFFGIPRLIMVLAPLSFLLFGIHPMKADVPAVIAYILPHIGLSMIVNSAISKTFRHSFSAGVYEVSIAPYTAVVTLLALINPKLGKFNVTEKGTRVDKAQFDYATSWPTFCLLAISALALMIAFPARLLLYSRNGADPGELDAILINSVWAVANFMTLIAAACVAYEQPQRRVSDRVSRHFPCSLASDTHAIVCRSADLSESGIRIIAESASHIPDRAEIAIRSDFGVHTRVRATLVWSRSRKSGDVEAAFRFLNIDSRTQEELVQLMFSGDQSWQAQTYPKDRVWQSFWRLITTFWRVTLPPSKGGAASGAVAAGVVAHTICLFFILTLFACAGGKSEPVAQQKAVPSILSESWHAYVRQFIQQDGRVIDRSAAGISTSEGQAYAMLRAVWIGDRETFDRTFNWAVNNLNSGIRDDHLWAWKWGKNSKGNWAVLDKAFASDADEDAAYALILAAQIWKDEKYNEQARYILRDLWKHGTIDVKGRRYLLAGDTLCKGISCRINPSYYAPYAYRVFPRVDPADNWTDLVDTSYNVVNTASGLASTGLPPDWVVLNTNTGEITRGSEKDAAFSYDAFRVFWRVQLDSELFHERRAEEYLRKNLKWITAEWENHHRLPAVISAAGKPLADYESLEMLAVLMAATRNAQMYEKLDAAYSQGFWGERNRYYLQNWAWFGSAAYLRFLGPLAQISLN